MIVGEGFLYQNTNIGKGVHREARSTPPPPAYAACPASGIVASCQYYEPRALTDCYCMQEHSGIGF